jgi:GR25 family glycosyltransferase involved in LPS biosynthesis
MENLEQLPTKIYCINLFDRKEKMAAFEINHKNILPIVRIEAVDCRPHNGPLGCFKSHLKVLTDYDHGKEHVLIMEDDAYPCDDFKERMECFYKELPNDWQIFMLGYWPMPGYKMNKVTDHIHKATDRVLATHCYLVNNNFIETLIGVYDKVLLKNLDRMFNILQDRYNVYTAMPSLSYQDGNYSDTSSTVTDYTGTKTFFKNKI